MGIKDEVMVVRTSNTNSRGHRVSKEKEDRNIIMRPSISCI